MKKYKMVLAAFALFTFAGVLSAVRPAKVESANVALPAATPSPRTKKPVAIQSPKPIVANTTTTAAEPGTTSTARTRSTTTRSRASARKSGTKKPTTGKNNRRNAGKRQHKPIR